MKQVKETFCSYTAELTENDTTVDEEAEECNEESPEILRNKLEILKARLERSKHSQQVQKFKYQRFIALLITKYRTKEDEIKRHLETKHNQLTSVLRSLYTLQAKLKREQKYFTTLLERNDSVIGAQNREIEQLRNVRSFDHCCCCYCCCCEYLDNQDGNRNGGGDEEEASDIKRCPPAVRTIAEDGNQPDLISGIKIDRAPQRSIGDYNNDRPNVFSVVDEDSISSNDFLEKNTYLVRDLKECPTGIIRGLRVCLTAEERQRDQSGGSTPKRRPEVLRSRVADVIEKRMKRKKHRNDAEEPETIESVDNSRRSSCTCHRNRHLCRKPYKANNCCHAHTENKEDHRRYKKRTSSATSNGSIFKIPRKDSTACSPGRSVVSISRSEPNTPRLPSDNKKVHRVYPRVPPKPKPLNDPDENDFRRLSNRQINSVKEEDEEESNELYVVTSSALSPEEMSRLSSICKQEETTWSSSSAIVGGSINERCNRRYNTVRGLGESTKAGNVDLQFLSEDDNSATEDPDKLKTGSSAESKIVRTVSALLLDSDNETRLEEEEEKDHEEETVNKVSRIVKKFEDMCSCKSSACNKKIEQGAASVINEGSVISGATIVCAIKSESDTSNDSPKRDKIFMKEVNNRSIDNNSTSNNNNSDEGIIDMRTNFEEFHLVDREIDVTYADKIIADDDYPGDNSGDTNRNNGNTGDCRTSEIIVASDGRCNANGTNRAETEGKEWNSGNRASLGYERFLEATGLCQKSILTPSRILSNHRNVVKPKDIKYRSRIKSHNGYSSNSTIKYWTEPYL